MAILDPQRKRRNIIVLAILTAVTLMSFSYQGFGPLNALRSGIQGLFSPVVSGSDTVTSPGTNIWTAITEYGSLKAEHEELQAEVERLKAAKITSAAAQETLHELLSEVDIEYIGGAETQLARVLEQPGNFQSYSLEVERGTRDGVRVGMPVISSAGLIGRITDTSYRTSKVRLIEHPDFPLGIRIVGTGEVALARGGGIGAELTVTEGLNDKSDISQGDYVVTSGIEGSSYPPDLAVGVVSSVEFDENLLQHSVKVTPVADMTNLRFVTIIMWTVDGDPADTETETGENGS